MPTPQLEILTRSKVDNYVETYWNSRNPAFPDYDGVDCTNFVSQCWNYAGIPMTVGWCSYKANKTLTTDSWVNVDEFYDYMVNKSAYYSVTGEPIAHVEWDSNKAKQGDIIQFYNEKAGGWFHSVIYKRYDPNLGILYASHSTNHKQKPLSDVYLKPDPNNGGTISAIRFICPNHAVD